MNIEGHRRCLVTYETRFSGRLNAAAGLAVLIASLGEHMPDVPLVILHTKPCENVKKFAKKFGPQCIFKEVCESEYRRWYSKPNAISLMLNEGYERVCWIDSDILIAKNCEEILFPSNDDVVRTAQSVNGPPCNPERHRLFFGCAPKFDPGVSISSSIVSVTKNHRSIIELWQKLIVNGKNIIEKNSEILFGDQEILETAIMNISDNNIVFSPILDEVEHLICSKSIGIRGSTRSILRKPPPLIHAPFYKPWWPLDRAYEYGSRAYLDSVPYTVEARRFTQKIKQIDEVPFLDWLSPSTFRSKICLWLPPWKSASPLLWYLVLEKFRRESYVPSESERRIALSLEAGDEATRRRNVASVPDGRQKAI